MADCIYQYSIPFIYFLPFWPLLYMESYGSVSHPVQLISVIDDFWLKSVQLPIQIPIGVYSIQMEGSFMLL